MEFLRFSFTLLKFTMTRDRFLSNTEEWVLSWSGRSIESLFPLVVIHNFAVLSVWRGKDIVFKSIGFNKKLIQISYLPDLVMTISVPKEWNFSQSSLDSSSTFGSSWTSLSGGSRERSGRGMCWDMSTSAGIRGDRATVCCSFGRIDAGTPAWAAKPGWIPGMYCGWAARIDDME